MALREGAIGLREVLFQAVSFMAPAGAVAFAIPQGAKYAGSALCLSVLLVLVPCIAVAISLGQLARQMPSAGAFYVFPARALHPAFGFFAAWAYTFVILAAPGGIALLFTMQVTGTFGSSPVVWAAGALLPLLLVYAFSVRGIRASAGAGTVVGFVEVIVVIGIAIVLLVQHRHALSVAPFRPSSSTAGFGGIFAGAVYTTLAFSGFEGAVPLAEETNQPRETMQRAMLLSLALGAGIFLLATYAAAIAVGSSFESFDISENGTAWVPLARTAWAPLGTVLVIVLFASMFGNQNAASNTLTRTWYAMGRDGHLPAALGRTHPSYQSPYVAASAQLMVSLAFVVLGATLGSERVYTACTAAGMALLVCTYIVANVSCAGFFARRSDLRVWLHIGVPLLGVIALVPVLCAAFGVGASVLPFVSPLEGPAAYGAIIAGAWMVLGVVAYAWHRMRAR
jgi:amino acid transporter